jgi:hypothetical protein
LIREEKEGSGCRAFYSYDYMNRRIEDRWVFDDGSEKVKKYQYDILGRKILEIDPFGGESHFIYDEHGQEIEKILPAVAVNSNELVRPVHKKEYDLHGYVIKEVDPAGFEINIERNIRGDPTRTIYQDGSEEQFFYFTNGKLYRHTKKNGSIDFYSYDCFDGKLQKFSSLRSPQKKPNMFMTLLGELKKSKIIKKK